MRTVRTTNKFNTTLKLVGLSALTFAIANCGSGLECGTGTRVSDDGTQCVPDGNNSGPDFNSVFQTDTSYGLSFTGTMPDVLKMGEGPQTHSVTVTNNETWSHDAVTVRLVAIDKEGTSEAELRQYMEDLKTYNVNCTDDCPYARNGNCDDGFPGDSDYSVCAIGSDCSDCGRRGPRQCTPDPAILYNPESDLCGPAAFCDRVSNTCHLRFFTLTSFVVEDIPAGGTVENVPYQVQLPPNWNRPGAYHLMMLVGEEWLQKTDDGEIIHHPWQPKPLPNGMHPRHWGAWYIHDKPFGIDAPPTGYKLSMTLDSSAFEVDLDPENNRSTFNATVSIAATGAPSAQYIELGAELRLPGHGRIDTRKYPSQKPGYEGNRRFRLLIQDPVTGAFSGGLQIFPECEGKPEGTKECAMPKDPLSPLPDGITTVPSGGTRELVLQLVLERRDQASLSETLNLRSQNPGLTQNDELPGKLHLELRQGFGFAGTDANAEKDVVFLPPAASKPASDSDITEPPPVTATDDGVFGPYAEKDNLTPTYFFKLGSDWAGASAQVKNISSKDRLKQGLIKQHFEADNYARISLLTFDIDLLKIYGLADIGSRRAITSNKGKADIKVPSSSLSWEQLFKDLISGNEPEFLTNTLLEFEFIPDEDCDDPEDGTTKCMLIDDPVEEKPQFGDITVDFGEELELPENSYSVEYEKEKKKMFCKGPICVKLGVSVSFEVGLKGTLGFFRDVSEAPEYFMGIEATFGPYAEAKGSGFGELSIVIARARIQGDITFMEGDFTPTLRMGLAQELRNQNNDQCWWTNTGRLTFVGPATLNLLSGTVKVQIFVGINIDVGFFTITLEEKIFEQVLISWDFLVQKQWELFNVSTDFLGGPGLCPDAPRPGSEFKSPIGCKTLSGADGYCPDSRKVTWDKFPVAKGKYDSRIYLTSGQCGEFVISGNVEPQTPGRMRGKDCRGDFLALYRPYGQSGADRGRPLEVEMKAEQCVHRLAEKAPGGFGELVSLSDGEAFCGERACENITLVEDWATEKNRTLDLDAVFSGTMDEFRVPYCVKGDKDETRWVMANLVTDGLVNDRGVNVRWEGKNDKDTRLYSDSTWWAYDGQNGAPGGSWKSLSYDSYTNEAHIGGAKNFRKPLDLGPIYAGVWGANFTGGFWSEAHKTRWIWANTGGANFDHPAKDAYFRKVFKATGTKYQAQVRCDDSCVIFLDGNEIQKVNSGWGTPSTFTFDTVRGGLHIIAVDANNAGQGPAGLSFAANVIEGGD